MEILAKDMRAIADSQNEQRAKERKHIEDKMRKDIQARIAAAARQGAYSLRLDSYLKELKMKVECLNDTDLRVLWHMMLFELKDNGFCARADDVTATVYWTL